MKTPPTLKEYSPSHTPHDSPILRFMITFVLCCMMGKAPRWGDFPKTGGLDSSITLLLCPYFGNGPTVASTLGLYHRLRGLEKVKSP